MKFSKVRITDHRASRASGPPGAGTHSPLERDYQPRPGAVACPPRPPATVHDKMLDGMSDTAIAGIIADSEKHNLRDQRNHETRWWSQRSSAARAIRRERQAAGTWTIAKPNRKEAA